MEWYDLIRMFTDCYYIISGIFTHLRSYWNGIWESHEVTQNTELQVPWIQTVHPLFL